MLEQVAEAKREGWEADETGAAAAAVAEAGMGWVAADEAAVAASDWVAAAETVAWAMADGVTEEAEAAEQAASG